MGCRNREIHLWISNANKCAMGEFCGRRSQVSGSHRSNHGRACRHQYLQCFTRSPAAYVWLLSSLLIADLPLSLCFTLAFRGYSTDSNDSWSCNESERCSVGPAQSIYLQCLGRHEHQNLGSRGLQISLLPRICLGFLFCLLHSFSSFIFCLLYPHSHFRFLLPPSVSSVSRLARRSLRFPIIRSLWTGSPSAKTKPCLSQLRLT